MPYGYLRENTASYWVDYPSGISASRWPSDGQGLNTTDLNASQLAGCSSANPVIIEAVEVKQATALTTIRIRPHSGTGTLFEIRAPIDTATQWIPIGGAYGVQVNQGFCVSADDGSTHTGIRVFYRFAGQ